MRERDRLKQYAAALQMWCHGFNTAEISDEISIEEFIVCRWIWHWRELSRMPVAS